MNFEIVNETSAHIAIDAILPILITATAEQNKERINEINTFLARIVMSKAVTSDTLTTLLTHYTIISTTSVLEDLGPITLVKLNDLILSLE